MASDAFQRLGEARRRHLEAILERDSAVPGTPEHRAAVHRAGTTHAAVRHWERKLAEERRR